MPTRYTIAQLVAQANATLNDNTAQEISPADVRDMVKNFLSTVRVSIATMRRDTNLVLSLSPSPIVFKPWSVNPYNDPPETAADLVAGTITKQVAALGNATAMDRITFYIGVAGTSGAEVTFQLFKNGVAQDILARVSTTGAANVVTATLSGVLVHTDDAVYDVRVNATNTANYTFSFGTFRIENVSVPS
jgi:hypothetical protein